LNRVLVAINAKTRTLQVQTALHDFLSPQIAPQFREFSARLKNFHKALENAAYKDIKNEDNSSMSLAIRRMRRYWGMWSDGWAYKLLPYSWSENRFKKLVQTKKEFGDSSAKLVAAIDRSDLPLKEKARLHNQVATMIGDLNGHIVHARDEFLETRSAIQLTGGALASSALLVGSFGALSPAILAGESMGAPVANGAVFGGGFSFGITGIGKTVEMAEMAKAKAHHKATRFMCELGRQVTANGDEAVKQTFEESLRGAALGAAVGYFFAQFGILGWTKAQLAIPILGTTFAISHEAELERQRLRTERNNRGEIAHMQDLNLTRFLLTTSLSKAVC